uniref:HDC00871 n=1 Tax=Drosophila melanogaster TaxID=7227 RepID=Q6IHV0_DROME|nr:TPA_inf: HDC00871 [Drosophila melanogaster]
MADSGGPGSKHMDPTTIDAGGGGAGAAGGDDVPPVPAVRRRRAHEQKSSREQVLEEEKSQQLETSTVTRTYMKTITTSLTTSSSSNVEEFILGEHAAGAAAAPSPNQQRLRQKVAQYEKVWSDGSSPVKRPAEQSSDELRLTDDQDEYDAENPFEIDVHEIERRLRQERQRGLAEAEAAKLAFQQVQLRHTTPPRRVEVTSDQVASPFNVTLRTTSRMSPGAEHGNVEEHLAPFNVTLRTTRRTKKKEFKELENFLEGERTVREVPSADGVRTIITSSMTSDGGYAEEKIYRHGEGYVSPRDSPSWSRSSYSSERSSVTPPRSVDLTAGGRRILIKLEQESELTEENQTRDETDLSFGRQEVAMATGNIDITVGGSNPRRRLYQQTTVQVGGGNRTSPQDSTPQRPRDLDLAGTTKTMLTSTPIGTKEQPQTGPKTLVSPAATCQLRGSSTEEPRKIVSHKTITSTTTKSTSSSTSATSSSSTSRKLIETSPVVVGKIAQIRTGKSNASDNDIDIDNDSDTEGRPASSIVIVSTPTRPTTPATASVSASAVTPSASISATAAHALSGIGTFSKSLRQDYQTLATQSGRSNESPSDQEYQEFQSTMASINYARSNSQYDSHIKEKRGKNRE